MHKYGGALILLYFLQGTFVFCAHKVLQADIYEEKGYYFYPSIDSGYRNFLINSWAEGPVVKKGHEYWISKPKYYIRIYKNHRNFPVAKCNFPAVLKGCENGSIEVLSEINDDFRKNFWPTYGAAIEHCYLQHVGESK